MSTYVVRYGNCYVPKWFPRSRRYTNSATDPRTKVWKTEFAAYRFLSLSEDEFMASDPVVETLPPQRVELHPGTDAWMRGDRFGTIRKLDKKNLVHVKMDRSGRILRLAPENVRPI